MSAIVQVSNCVRGIGAISVPVYEFHMHGLVVSKKLSSWIVIYVHASKRRKCDINVILP